MNFHSLDYFLVLAREKNFTRAAEALHITQQSLSSHIAGLEKELGCTLLVRRTPLELTYAGRKFLHYAESIGQTRQTMEREFCDISENQKGELRVGIGYTRGRTIMPRLIPAFQRQYPNVEIMLRECSNDAIQKALLSGGIDLAIAAYPSTLSRTVAAQAADELLNISGILTSFVLYPAGEQVIISARSIGECNVQVVLEALGGGGNAATAGAQVKGKPLREVLEALVASIDKFYENS